MTFLCQLTLLLVACLGTLLFWIAAERKRKHRLLTRPAPVFNDWYQEFYGKDCEDLSQIAVKTVLTVIAGLISIEPTQLRPTDRLNSELALPEAGALDDTLELFEESLSDVFGRRITIQANWSTLDDVIRGVAASGRNERDGGEIKEK